MGWQGELTQGQALLAAPAQHLAGKMHRNHWLSGGKSTPGPEVTPTEAGKRLTPPSPKAPSDCVVIVSPLLLM